MSDVLHRTTMEYRLSVNTPDFDEADWVVNPDLSSVVGVPQYHWKFAGDTVSEMDAGEKAVVDEQRAASPAGEVHFEQVTAGNKVTKETWYRYLVDNVLKYKIREMTYGWQGSVLLTETEKTFDLAGNVLSTNVYGWSTVGDI